MPTSEKKVQDSRRAKRYPSNIVAVMTHDRTRFDIRIKDVSNLGCCFSSEADLKLGDEIVLMVEDMTMVATVAWCAPPLSGANFHREINLLRIVRDNIHRPAFLNRRLAGAMAPPPKKD